MCIYKTRAHINFKSIYIYIYIILLMKTKSVKKYFTYLIYLRVVWYYHRYHMHMHIIPHIKYSPYLKIHVFSFVIFYKIFFTNSKIYLKYYFFKHTQLPHYTILPYTTKRTLVKLINKYIDTAVVNNLLLLKTIFQNRNNN